MAAWAGLTYGDVKQYVLAVAGDCCSDTPQLESLLSSTAQEMYIRLEDCEPVSETVITTEESIPGYYLPCVPTTSGGITDVFFETVLGMTDVNGNRLPQHTNRCDLAHGSCCCAAGTIPWDPWCTSWQLTTKPTDFLLAGFDTSRMITLYPTPVDRQTYTVQGHIAFDPVTYDMAVGAPVPTKVWRSVALPVGLHYAYQELVLAMALMGVDVTRAGLSSTKSGQMFNAWKERQVRSDYVLGTTMVIGRNSNQGPYLSNDDYDHDYPVEVFQKVSP